jgi:hypothetical protein
VPSSDDSSKKVGVARARGRSFPKGNPGRKRGSKNRSTLITAALLEGEADEIVRKGMELAKAGNVVMLKFFLSRIVPPERTITFDWPGVNSADDAPEALGAIMRLVSEGTITPSEGAALASVVHTYSRVVENADLVKRLDLLEGEVWTLRGNRNVRGG